MGEPLEEQDYKVVLAQKRFLFRTQDVPVADRSKLQHDIVGLLQAHDMAPLYEEVCGELGVSGNAAALGEMRERNAKQLAELDEKIKDAEVNAGEMEVRDALQARADYLCGIGDHAAALEAFAAAEAKTAGVGPKMDLAFSQIRLELSRGDWGAVKAGLDKARGLCDKGGDWERKNKLKVYEAVFLMATRQFKRAAELLLDAIATFSSGELMSYERCIFYTVLLAVVALDRPTLKSKVIDSPEVLSVIDSLPHLRPFLSSLYDCQYAQFFKAFSGLSDEIRADMYLHPHFRYYMREVRAAAYAQFLESYKSVTLASMAATFGVSPDFLDAELADFIVAGRLPAKVDKVAGVVETNRADAKTALYQQTIKQGDLLLNRLQKLSKVIDIE
ncbi:hypothetical protein CHLNCDRAFT_55933 [Chlorella variabilis]|uniref:26S proteasome regulatory subunit RPN7 n=1 Tax=Chlorella variabilis TaxID=554065 RepID=E1Z2J7_CHLVA|nr:hypothetical protein CHLNCDRAFT_55933 [Chlorella variabilis]EFN60012.1 hypothetical protein CHLNCDRAFT_55933 [Chlorella variabilis]|eukprot:XP_005852114.1 hypothetical protein CHLNCDRAFT_55933 [Chlorella variabilis]